MATLKYLLLLSICGFMLALGGAATAQDRQLVPVPTWPENGRIPPQYDDRYVFLTSDKHTIVVLVPERPNEGMAGPKRIIRVPIWNNVAPVVAVSLTTTSATIRYEYRITNGKEAQDPIGKFSLVTAAPHSNLKVTHVPTNQGTPWGGAAANVASAPHRDLQKPLGRYVMWFQHGDNVIPPEATLAGFAIESDYLPGITTAWFSVGKLVEFDQSWPQKIFEQLELLEHPRWREAGVVSIGPMFARGTSKEAMVPVFQEDVQQLNKAGVLDPSSPFVQEALTALSTLRRNPRESQVIAAIPQTSTETAIAAALELTLEMKLRK